MARPSMTRIDWKAERDRIDLPDVVAGLLRCPAPKRQGRRHLWLCPFHDDHNPSLVVDPDSRRWSCYPCGIGGDAADLVERLEQVSFPEAVARLTGGGFVISGTTRPRPRPSARPEPKHSRVPGEEAQALVAESSARLWSPDGAHALAYLTGARCLSADTIRVARLGWTPGVRLKTKDGRPYIARGIVIPWFDGGRLALVKIRQPEGERPKYCETFRDRPTLYPGLDRIRPGQALAIPEGEFDALLLGQDLGDLATVVTLGSASARPDPAIFGEMLAAPRWYVATDADEAGDLAAACWPPRARRARPPDPFNDWTEARQAGVDLRRWWSDRLGGIETPPLFTWDELDGRRWGPAEDDPAPGIILDRPDPARRRLALEALGLGPGDANESG